ncbi:MAG: HAD family phosphatase [Patescibacteria group bacterium]|nr:HAD family phosphatase [Actinomycetota bacterium]MCL5439081.1 HAD family phosphatase [Patescibacteria group bacterium]
MFKLVIFDYDGLIVNSEQVIFEAIKELFKKYKKSLTWEYYLKHIGTPKLIALRHFHADYSLKISFKKFVKERDEIVKKYINDKIKLMPGLLTLLNYLHSKKIAMAIATSGNKNYVSEGLKKFKIKKYFRTVVYVEDVERGKPYPDLIFEVLKRTNYKPSEAIILEDSPSGIEAAFRAKVFSVAIPTRGVDYKKFSKVSVVCNNLNQVKKMIQNQKLPFAKKI